MNRERGSATLVVMTFLAILLVIVIANAAAALWTAGRDQSLQKCARLAAECITNGAARELLSHLVQRTHQENSGHECPG